MEPPGFLFPGVGVFKRSTWVEAGNLSHPLRRLDGPIVRGPSQVVARGVPGKTIASRMWEPRDLVGAGPIGAKPDASDFCRSNPILVGERMKWAADFRA